MSPTISLEVAAGIARAHQEIAAAEGLLETLRKAKSDCRLPDFRDAYSRSRGLQLGIPQESAGSYRCYDLSPQLAIYVIEAHIGRKRTELGELSLAARMELDGEAVGPAAQTGGIP